jgi:putative hydrolase
MTTPHVQSAPNGAGWNHWIAARFRDAARLLEQQGADPFRTGAYARAATALDAMEQSVADIHSREGVDGLIALPAIGKSLAAAIAEMLQTGKWQQLERLRGSLDPEKLYQTIPGVGPKLAAEIVSALDVDTLEELEVAAHDGRLEKVSGVGERRASSIRHSLASMLQRRRPMARTQADARPSASDLLSVDAEYRDKAKAGRLPVITPRRFSSNQLPILHTSRGEWQFTALYSNTPRAHDLGRTRDWVVIYYHHDHEPEAQCTVVTEHAGPLRGLRVIRGRERESGEAYAHPGHSTATGAD